MVGTTKQIANDCKAKIEALQPITYWNSSEELTIRDGNYDDNIVATSGSHRSVWCYWSGGTIDLAALSLGGAVVREADLTIQVLYQSPGLDKEAFEQATQMAREDTDQIITTLQTVATLPVATDGTGVLIGRCHNRVFVDGSDSIDMQDGKVLLTMQFRIQYEIISGGY